MTVLNFIASSLVMYLVATYVVDAVDAFVGAIQMRRWTYAGAIVVSFIVLVAIFLI